jgi:phage gp46-like protein
MSDLATTLIQGNAFFGFDWSRDAAGPGLVMDDGLQSAVVISLFTDRRADANDLPTNAPGGDRRGWWGDSFGDVPGDRIGSRLWLLAREKAKEALQWLLDDGIASAVNVDAQWMDGRQGVLQLNVEIVRASKPVTKYQFEAFWKGN